MKSRKLTLTREVTIDVEVDVEVTPGSKDYFSKWFGSYLPGDPPEVDITDVRVAGVAVDIDCVLSKEDIAAVEEQALEEAAEAERDAAADRADFECDRARDARLGC